jgi:hypothetical protein
MLLTQFFTSTLVKSHNFQFLSDILGIISKYKV